MNDDLYTAKCIWKIMRKQFHEIAPQLAQFSQRVHVVCAHSDKQRTRTMISSKAFNQRHIPALSRLNDGEMNH